jgi:hypothetical protein
MMAMSTGSDSTVAAELPKDVRYYEHWVFMKRNADHDYDIPPTVVATTCNVEDAIDIMIEADYEIYDDEKAEILRHMCIGEMYMMNEDTCVWKTRSVRRRLIIWSHRQYYDRRMDTDNFMEVWVAYRKYMDYIDNCYDNEHRLSEKEKELLRRHAPYEDLVFPEEHVASSVAALASTTVSASALAKVEAPASASARPNTEPVYAVTASASSPFWNGAVTRSLGETPQTVVEGHHNIKKRPARMWDDDDYAERNPGSALRSDGSVQDEMDADEEEELVHTFKQARIGYYTDVEVKVEVEEEDDDI